MLNYTELSDSERVLDALFQKTNTAILILDQSAVILQANQGFQKLVGYSTFDLVGNSFAKFIPLEDRVFALSCLSNDDRDDYEIRFVSAIGKTLLLQANHATISSEPGSRIYILILRDISDEKKNTRLMENMQKAAQIGGWEFDSITSNFICTGQALEILGINHAEEIKGSLLKTRFESKSWLGLLKYFLLIQKKSYPYHHDSTISVEGQIRHIRIFAQPVVYEGMVVKILGTVQDVTQIVTRERELNKLSLIAARVSNGVVITDSERRIEWVNEGFWRMTGYRLDEVIGKTPGSILQGEKTDKELALNIRDRINKGEVVRAEVLNYRKNKTEYWNELTITPLKDQSGNIERFIAIQNDISERKYAEKALIRSLFEKETLLKEMHHRVKNNLTVISSLLSLQADSITEESSRRVFQESINRIYSMASIHEKLYQSEDFSAIDFGEYTVELAEALDMSHQQTSFRIEKKFDLDSIYLNITQAVPCGLILNELLTNVYQHAFKNRSTGTLSVIFKEQNENLILEVKDNGVGIENVDKIQSRGTLGMVLLQSLAKQLRGKLHITSDNGTTVTVVFPISGPD